LFVEIGEQAHVAQMRRERPRTIPVVDHLLEAGKLFLLEHQPQARGPDQQAQHLCARDDIGGDRVAREGAHLAEDLARFEEDLFVRAQIDRQIREHEGLAASGAAGLRGLLHGLFGRRAIEDLLEAIGPRSRGGGHFGGRRFAPL